MGKLEKLIEQVRDKDNRIKKLKKENKKLVSERDLLKFDLFKRCLLCGKIPTTKHSLNGKHKKPFVPLCEDCHEMVEIYKDIIKFLKKIKKFDKRLKRKEDSA